MLQISDNEGNPGFAQKLEIFAQTPWREPTGRVAGLTHEVWPGVMLLLCAKACVHSKVCGRVRTDYQHDLFMNTCLYCLRILTGFAL